MSIIRGVKKAIDFVMPGVAKALLYYVYPSAYTKWYYVNYFVVPLVRKQIGDVVFSGPFKGMKYIDKCMDQAPLGPKLVGTFEKELSIVLKSIFAANYQTIINVGCAEGYYAVGFAKACPGAKLVCYEAKHKQHNMVVNLAAVNGVSHQLTIHGLCRCEDLKRAVELSGTALVFCDIEGGELDLLVPDLVPELAKVDLLVETHDCMRPDVSSILLSRFAPTHDIVVLETKPRSDEDWPGIPEIPERHWCDLMWEARGAPQSWLWMKKKP